MKKIIAVLSVLALLGTAVFAQATDVKVGNVNATVYADAKAYYGVQVMNVDKTNYAAMGMLSQIAGATTSDGTATFVGLKNESSVKLGTKLASADGKFTADVAAKLDTTVSVYNAWVAYDLGPVAVKYNSAGSSGRWDADIMYVGDSSMQNSLDFTIKPVPGIGYAFFTVMSATGVTGTVKYENDIRRIAPVMQAGYVYTVDLDSMGAVEATAGAVFDANSAYPVYMGFGGAKWTKGAMATEVGSMVVSLTGVFGANTASIAGMTSTDMEAATLNVTDVRMTGFNGTTYIGANTVSKNLGLDSYVGGGRLVAAATLWTGGVVGVDARLSQILFGGYNKNLTSMKFGGAVTQFFSANFYAVVGGGYESYSVNTGDVAYTNAFLTGAFGLGPQGGTVASGYEIFLGAGFMF